MIPQTTSSIGGNKETMKTIRRITAFTLIELLTVIAIILVLAALLFPAIKLVLIKGEVSKAQSAVQNLSGAFRAYYTEYGKWPAAETAAATPTILISTKLVGLLKGDDNNGTVAASTDANTLDVVYNGNPRHIAFLEFKVADFVVPSLNVTNFVDPWKGIYRCRFNSKYDNQVPDPFLPYSPPANLVSGGFLVWSDGPDGQEDPNCGDPPNFITTPCVNKDNVKSW
jgi:prepilin-type N-terminal cleavage/methylation domain-containing protein